MAVKHPGMYLPTRELQDREIPGKKYIMQEYKEYSMIVTSIINHVNIPCMWYLMVQYLQKACSKKNMNLSLRFSCFACLRFLAATALERFERRLPARDPDTPSGYGISMISQEIKKMEFECLRCFRQHLATK